MVVGTPQIVIFALSATGLSLNALEQVLLFKQQDLGKSFTTLILLLSYSDCIICLSSICRASGIALGIDTKHNELFNAASFSLILLGFLGNSTIVWLMTMERFLATCFPFKHRSLVSKWRTVKMVGLLWTLSAIISAVVAYLQFKEGGHYFLAPRILRSFFISTFGLLLVCYSIIFMRVRRNNMRQSKCNQSYKETNGRKGNRLRNKQQRSVLSLCCKIVLCFFICHSVYVANSFHSPNRANLEESFFTAFGVYLIIAVTSVDPLLYFFNTCKFRCKNKNNSQSARNPSSQRSTTEREMNLKEICT
eukprot:gene1900-16399_t